MDMIGGVYNDFGYFIFSHIMVSRQDAKNAKFFNFLGFLCALCDLA